ncbi:MAG: class B sortase [Clostridia bacterium]|nr:class B sortase [Clostridia bacterium]
MEHGKPVPPVRRRYHPHTETETVNPQASTPHLPEKTAIVEDTPISIEQSQEHFNIQNKPAVQMPAIDESNTEFSNQIPDYLKRNPKSNVQWSFDIEDQTTDVAEESLHYPSQYSTQHAEPKGTFFPNLPAMKKRLPFYLGIVFCSAVLILSSSMLIRYYSQIHRANSASGQLRELYHTDDTATLLPTVAPTPSPSPVPVTTTNAPIQETVQPTITPEPTQQSPVDDFLSYWPSRYPGNEEMRIQERFTPLRQQNRDVVGWLTIEGVLDEPVFQRDNSYYLTHDANGKKNPTGALFLDENCNLRTVPMQTLIHGHNMKEGAMFGSLKKYKVKDASFYRAHPFIQFDSLYENTTYVIFAVAEVNIVSGNTHYFPFWHKFRFDDYESFRQYVSLAKEYSRFKVNIDVQPGDRLLTLATCSSGDDNLRLIVMARELREDEDMIQLSNHIYSATAK